MYYFKHIVAVILSISEESIGTKGCFALFNMTWDYSSRNGWKIGLHRRWSFGSCCILLKSFSSSVRCRAWRFSLRRFALLAFGSTTHFDTTSVQASATWAIVAWCFSAISCRTTFSKILPWAKGEYALTSTLFSWQNVLMFTGSNNGCSSIWLVNILFQVCCIASSSWAIGKLLTPIWRIFPSCWSWSNASSAAWCPSWVFGRCRRTRSR